MTYSVTSSAQISNFLSALGLGFVLGVLFYLIEFVRKIISNKKTAIIIQDITFFIAVSFLCFCFMQVYTDGEVRFDLILSSVCGFAVLSLSVGKYIRCFFEKLSSKLKGIVNLILSPLRFIKKLIDKITNRFKNAIKSTKVKVSETDKSEGTKSKKLFSNKLQKNKKKSDNSLEKVS